MRIKQREHAKRFCLFYSHNNKVDTFWGEIQEVRKGLWAYISGLCLPDQSASEKQIPITRGNNSPWAALCK